MLNLTRHLIFDALIGVVFLLVCVYERLMCDTWRLETILAEALENNLDMLRLLSVIRFTPSLMNVLTEATHIWFHNNTCLPQYFPSHDPRNRA